jgi:hypothetical protein
LQLPHGIGGSRPRSKASFPEVRKRDPEGLQSQLGLRSHVHRGDRRLGGVALLGFRKQGPKVPVTFDSTQCMCHVLSIDLGSATQHVRGLIRISIGRLTPLPTNELLVCRHREIFWARPAAGSDATELRGIGKGKKIYKMQYCLAEYMREKTRQ